MLRSEPNLYRRLGLDEHCSDADVKKKYRALALKLHPDKGGDPEEFKAVSEAYAVLSSAEKRSASTPNQMRWKGTPLSSSYRATSWCTEKAAATQCARRNFILSGIVVYSLLRSTSSGPCRLQWQLDAGYGRGSSDALHRRCENSGMARTLP